ncbi:MAG: hypothetical protein K9J48_05395, partial [Desulfohalobiaceae bacterium]|nr:hypothetical protein [Desulfohalobiaceae bacterium]
PVLNFLRLLLRGHPCPHPSPTFEKKWVRGFPHRRSQENYAEPPPKRSKNPVVASPYLFEMGNELFRKYFYADLNQ